MFFGCFVVHTHTKLIGGEIERDYILYISIKGFGNRLKICDTICGGLVFEKRLMTSGISLRVFKLYY